MLGAMFGLYLIVGTGIPFLLGLLLACAFIAIVAILLYYNSVRPFGGNLGSSLGWLMATLGAGIVLKNVAMLTLM